MNRQELDYSVIFFGVTRSNKIRGTLMVAGNKMKSEDAAGFLEMKRLINF